MLRSYRMCENENQRSAWSTVNRGLSSAGGSLFRNALNAKMPIRDLTKFLLAWCRTEYSLFGGHNAKLLAVSPIKTINKRLGGSRDRISILRMAKIGRPTAVELSDRFELTVKNHFSICFIGVPKVKSIKNVVG